MKHKEDNTFRYRSFVDALSSIDIDVVHRIRRVDDSAEEGSTFFLEKLTELQELNCTESFENFTAELGPDIETLPQLLITKDEVVRKLKEHLVKDGSLAIPALLDLTTALARDLQYEFYPYFEEFFHVIVQLLRTRDAEQLEACFVALATMFKFLWRYVVKNVQNFFPMYVRLLKKSEPFHIRLFAAQSFAFLFRKVPDRVGFLVYLRKELKENPDVSEGIGLLLFESVRGIKIKLHSTFEETASLLLDLFKEGDGKSDLSDVMRTMFERLAGHVGSKVAGAESLRVWKYLREKICGEENIRESNPEGWLCALGLCQQLTEYHGGRIVSDPDLLLDICSCAAKLASRKEEEAIAVATAVEVFVAQSTRSLALESISKGVSAIFNSGCSSESLCDFAVALAQRGFPYFDSHVLPQFSAAIVTALCATERDERSMMVFLRGMAKICDAKDVIFRFEPHILRFLPADVAKKKPNLSCLISDWLFGSLSTWEANGQTSKQEFFFVLNIVPRCSPLDLGKSQDALESLWKKLLSACGLAKGADCGNFDESAKEECWSALFLTAHAIYKSSDPHFFADLLTEDLLTALVTCPRAGDPRCLKIVHFGLSCRKDAGLTERFTCQALEPLYEALKFNLMSHDAAVRRTTLEIFDFYPVELAKENAGGLTVFQLCLKAEGFALSVQEYMSKLQWLSKLAYDMVQSSLPIGHRYDVAPVLYIMGNLYSNLSPMWDPCMDLLGSHAVGLPREKFWNEAFKPALERALESARTVVESSISLDASGASEGDDADFSDLMNKLKARVGRNDGPGNLVGGLAGTKPDHVNWRNLLWSAMERFVYVVEPFHPVLVDLFLRFLEKEYYRSDMSFMREENLMRESDLDVTESKEMTGPRKMKLKTPAHQSLLAHLKVFAKLKNPNGMSKSTTMRKTFYDLLLNKNAVVQKAALDCVCAFGPKTCPASKEAPRERLYKIQDEKSFKAEMMELCLDLSKDLVDEEYRESLMEIVLPISFAKMMHRVDSKLSGKEGWRDRVSLVLRFLSQGCRDSEFSLFFQKALGEDLWKLGETLWTEDDGGCDLTVRPPLRTRKAFLILMESVFQKIGNRMKGDLLSRILRVIIAIGGQAVSLLKRDDLPDKAVEKLKEIRGFALKRMKEFMDVFEQYSWTSAELDSVFTYFVWPQLPKLAEESVSAASHLLQFIASFGKFPRYYPLLRKKPVDFESDMTPLSAVVQLMQVDQISDAVFGLVMEFFEDLTTLNESGEEYEPLPIPEAAEKPDFMDTSDGTLNFGTRLLVPHVSKILAALRKALFREEAKPADPKSSGKPVAGSGARQLTNERTLTVLLRLSEVTDDGEQSEVLVGLLLSQLSGKPVLKPEPRLKLMATVANLARNIGRKADRRKYFRQLAPLLAKKTGQTESQQLVAVFEAVFGVDRDGDVERVDEDWRWLRNFVVDGHAWNPRRADEPLVGKRMDALSRANALFREGADLSEDALLVIAYTGLQFISWTEEMALRDAGSNVIQELVRYLFRFRSGEHYLIFEFLPNVLLVAVRRGLVHQNEAVRFEFVANLAVMVAESAKADLGPKVLRELSQLTHADPNVDFFENVNHLQLQRRTKALVRLARGIQAGDYKFSVETIGQILMLFPSTFLFNPTYAKNNNLVDAALELQGAVASTLPWYRYKDLLLYCVKRVTTATDHHKVAVKALAGVLDAFHFDVASSGTKTVTVEPAPVSLPPPDEAEAPTAAPDADDPEDLTVLVEDGDGGEADVSRDDRKPAEKKSAMPSKIFDAIVGHLLPKLEALLAKRTAAHSAHKSNQKATYQEDEDVLRVPIALALTKLLVKLPAGILRLRLPSIFLKVASFLKSRADGVRTSARAVLIKMMMTLGCRHFESLVREARTVLDRGYQLHVLVFTLHAVLHALHTSEVEPRCIQPGDLDASVKSLVEICHLELFGDLAEEKEVDAIASKWKEARGGKAFELYEIMARYVSRGRVLDLMKPLQEVLSTTRSSKSVMRVTKCLEHIVLGLVENASLKDADLVLLAKGLVTDGIPQLQQSAGGGKGPSSAAAGKKRDRRLRPDGEIFLIPAEPKRAGPAPRSAAKTHAHLLIMTGFQILYFSLRRQRVAVGPGGNVKELDSFLPHLIRCLDNPNVKLVTISLRCLGWVLKAGQDNLPSFNDVTRKALKEKLFAIVHKYAAPGMAIPDNMEMIVVTFKLLTQLIRDSKKIDLTSDQMRILLIHIEEDLKESSRQASAFGLLRAILGKKMTSKELPDVMRGVSKMSIVANSVQELGQARQAYMAYLMDYPLRDNEIRNAVDFYLGQLEYEILSGRESALEMLNAMINTFPVKKIEEMGSPLFVSLVARLMNEPDAKARKMTALALENLVKKLGPESRDSFWMLTLLWLKDKKVVNRRLGAQVISIFLRAEGEKFGTRLKTVLPSLARILKPSLYMDVPGDAGAGSGKLEKDPDDTDDEDDHDEAARRLELKDHFLIFAFRFLAAVLQESKENSPMYSDRKQVKAIEQLLRSAEAMLLHPHNMVKLDSARIVGIVFSFLGEPRRVLADCGWDGTDSRGRGSQPGPQQGQRYAVCLRFLVGAGGVAWKRKIVDMCFACMSQLQSKLLNDALGEQVIKNLVYLSKFVVILSSSPDTQFRPERVNLDAESESDDEEDDEEDAKEEEEEEEEEEAEPPEVISLDDSDDDDGGVKDGSFVFNLSSAAAADDMDIPEPFLDDCDEEELARRGRELSPASDEGVSVASADDLDDHLAKYLSIQWLAKKLRKEANLEVVKNPTVTLKRKNVLRWIGGLSVAVKKELGTDALLEILPLLLPPVVREFSDPDCPADLKKLCEEVSRLLKTLVGAERYSRTFAEAQAALSSIKLKRKRKRALLNVTHPEAAAKKRMKVNEAKAVSRKRKIQESKIRKNFGGKKLKTLASVPG